MVAAMGVGMLSAKSNLQSVGVWKAKLWPIVAARVICVELAHWDRTGQAPRSMRRPTKLLQASQMFRYLSYV